MSKLLTMISDTHNQHSQLTIPESWCLVHSGDATMRGSEKEVIDFLNWFQYQPATHKIYVAGNHDYWTQRNHFEVFAQASAREIHYLQDSGVTLDGVNFYGSPWQPWFHDWAWNFSSNPTHYKEQAQTIWGRIPLDTHVLITHGPAYGILDKVDHPSVREDPHVGCKYLLKRIQQVRPLIHVAGHIHEGYGKQLTDGTLFLNASSQDLKYSGAVNKPHCIDLDDFLPDDELTLPAAETDLTTGDK